MFCLKTIKKMPMAAVGLIDLAACGADQVICSLAKRGEKAIKRLEKKASHMNSCCEEAMVTEHP